MEKFFFGYHAFDAAFALKLAGDLKNAGVKLWVDVLEAQSREEAIASCEAMVVVLSPEYVAHYKDELAVMAGRDINPVVIRAIMDWPAGIRRDWAVDFQGNYDYLSQLKILLTKLRPQMLVGSPPDAAEQYLNRHLIPVPHYVPLRAYVRRLTLNVEFDIEAGEPSKFETAALPDAREAVAIYPACIVVGAPGGGKTATLQESFRSAVQAYLVAPEEVPMPLYLDLATWSDGVRLRKFIQSQVPGDYNQVALYLDNLELIGPRNASMLRDWLKRGDLPTKLVVACRAAAYNGGLGLPVVTLDIMDRERIQQVAEDYLGAEQAAAFVAHILPDGDTITNPLMTIPYLLIAMLRVYAAHGEVPNSAGMLLHQYVQILSDADFEDFRDNLARLAAGILDDEERGFVDVKWAVVQMGGRRRWLRGAVDEDKLLLLQKAERVGLLEIHDERLRFSHQLMQSYFAALALMQGGVSNVLGPPTFDNREFRRIPGKWDQAVRLLCGLVTDPETVVVDVLEKDPYLAADCVISGVEVSDVINERIREVLVGELEKNDWRETSAAINALRHLDENYLVQLLIEEYMPYGNVYERRVAIRALGEIGHPASIPLLVEALQEDVVREVAKQALVDIGDAAVTEVVGALKHERWETRDAAAQVLRQIATDDVIASMIKVLFDPAYEVRWSMVTALVARGDAAVADLLEIVNSPDTLDPEDDVCRAAASTLARIGSEAALAGLMDALQDADPRRRAVVAEALAETNHPEVVLALKARLADEIYWDENETVADVAAFALERIGSSEALQALYEWRRKADND